MPADGHEAPVITSDVFYALLRDWERGPNRPLKVDGRVNLNSVDFRLELEFHDITFLGPVILDHARLRASLSFVNCNFEGGLSAKNIEIEGNLDLHDCRFSVQIAHDDCLLNLAYCDVHGSLRLFRVDCPGAVSLLDARVRSSIEIEGCALSSRVSEVPALCADRATVGGSCRIRFSGPKPGLPRLTKEEPRPTRISGGISATNLEINGNLEFEGLKKEKYRWDIIGGVNLEGMKAKSVSFNGIFIKGQLNVSHSAIVSFMIKNTFVTEQIQMIACSAKYIHLIRLIVQKDAVLLYIKCNSILRIEAANRRPARNSRPALHLGGNLHLEGCEIAGQLEVRSSRIRGAVLMNGSRVGSFLVGMYGERNHFGALHVVDSTFSSYVRLHGLRIERQARKAAPKDSPNNSHEPTLEGCAITNTRFDAGLSFWQPYRTTMHANEPHRVYTAWDADCRRCEIASKLEIIDCRINGDLDLSRVVVRAGEDEGAAGGGIVLDRTRVTGDVWFRSPQSPLMEHKDSRRLRTKSAQWIAQRVKAARATPADTAPAEADEVRACASFLEMRHLSTTNLFLTGLRLGAPAAGDPDSADQPGTTPSSRVGHVFADRMEVTGRMRCYGRIRDEHVPEMEDIADLVRCAQEEDQKRRAQGNAPAGAGPWLFEAYPEIPRALHLENARIGDLTISACGFCKREGTAQENGIVLEGTTISHLRSPRIAHCEQGQGFPVPLDLSDLKVGRWSFETEDDELSDGASGGDKAQNYIDFLANDSFHRDLYRAVYQQLHNSGQEAEARRVFVAEHKRAFRQEASRLVDRLCSEEFRGQCRERCMELTCAARSRATGWLDKHPALSGMVRSFADRVAGFSRRGTQDVIKLCQIVWTSVVLPFRYFLDRVYHLLLDYGVKPLRVLVPIIGLALFTFLVFAREPGNFELAERQRIVIAGQRGIPVDFPSADRGIGYCDDGELLGPVPGEWGTMEAVWLTLRYHIPIIGLTARAEYEPTDDRPAVWSFWPETRELSCHGLAQYAPMWQRRAPVATDGMTPDTWFSAMALTNWALWPILLAFLLRRAFREQQ